MPSPPHESSSVPRPCRDTRTRRRWRSPELLGYREPEAAQLAQSADDRVGNVAVGAVHVLAWDVLAPREAVEHLGDHREVLAEVSRPGVSASERAVGGRGARRRTRRTVGTSRRRRPRAPRGRGCASRVAQREPQEGAREGRLGVPLRRSPRPSGRCNGAGGVSDVVGERLVEVDAARASAREPRIDEPLGPVHQIGCFNEVKCGRGHK